MKHDGAQIPAKPVLRKYARCIEHQVWHFIIETYIFHVIELHLVFHRILEFRNCQTCWPWEHHFQYTVVSYVIQGSSVRQTLFKKETACHGIDRHKLPTKRCILRQIGMIMTQWRKNACHIKDWNLNRRLSNISLLEIKLEDIEDILNIIILLNWKNTITNVNYLYQFLRAHYDITCG